MNKKKSPPIKVQEEIARLASFTRLNPRPVVEIDLHGNIIYQNAATKATFPDLQKKGIRHPYFSNFKSIVKILKRGAKSFNRDIKIQNKWFRHFFYYMPDLSSILVYGSDITDQKKAESGLIESEKRYHLLFEKMNYGYALQDIIFDKRHKPVDYRFVDVNPAFEKLSKLSRDQIVGKTANELAPNSQSKESIKSRKEYDQVATTGKPMYVESYNAKTKKYFELYAYKPNEHQMALIFSDITARKKTDEEKNNFISIMSHELRNPLTPIMANAQFIKSLLQDQQIENPAIHEAVDVIEKESKMMADLLNDILDVSRLSRNKIELKKSKVDMCEIVKNSVKASMPFIATKGQEVSVVFGQNPLYLNADPVRLEQIMVNIINNASKYTQPKGRIEIYAGLKNKKMELRVKDNGIGMEATKIKRVFELFSDHGQPFMGIGGLGIGLNIVKNLVSLHKGTILVKSKGHNKGSEFIIRLPALSRTVYQKFSAAAGSGSAPKNVSRVLIVDDNEDIRNAISKILRAQGHVIEATHNGTRAVKISKVFKPDAAFIDIGLPDINGYQVAKMIRKNEGSAKKIKLIAFTGYGQEKDKKLAKEAGFDHHLTKPIDINHLIKLI